MTSPQPQIAIKQQEIKFLFFLSNFITPNTSPFRHQIKPPMYSSGGPYPENSGDNNEKHIDEILSNTPIYLHSEPN